MDVSGVSAASILRVEADTALSISTAAHYLKFESLAAKIILLHVMPCSLVDRRQRFGATCYLIFHGKSDIA
jgi:hypothetical protein